MNFIKLVNHLNLLNCFGVIIIIPYLYYSEIC